MDSEMPKYVVERMLGEIVQTSEEIDAPSPFRAASDATGRSMSIWDGENAYVRISQAGVHRSVAFVCRHQAGRRRRRRRLGSWVWGFTCLGRRPGGFYPLL